MLKTKWFSLSLLPIILASCATSTITNLTPTQQPRNPNGQYLIEYDWDSNMQTLRPDSITPYVVVDLNTYPMRRQLLMTNRWEALVPVSKDKGSLTYHFKVDYEYSKFGKAGKGSRLSPEYKLVIMDN